MSKSPCWFFSLMNSTISLVFREQISTSCSPGAPSRTLVHMLSRDLGICCANHLVWNRQNTE